MVERVNAEIKRETKVVGAFPGRESLLRPVGSILMDTNEEWLTGYRYLNMAEFLDKQIENRDSKAESSHELSTVLLADL